MRREAEKQQQQSKPRVGAQAPRYVTVLFHDIERADLPRSSHATYVYKWNVHGVAPEKGMYVKPHGATSSAVVVREATPRDMAEAQEAGYSAKELKLIKVFSDDEVKAAVERRKKREMAWLDMMRREAGFEVKGPQRTTVPKGMRPIPIPVQQVPAEQAHAYARTWRDAIDFGQAHDLPEEEIAAFKAIRRQWFDIEDGR